MNASSIDEAECQLTGYAGMVAGARPDHALQALDTAAAAMVPFIQAGAIDRRYVSDCLMETSERRGFIALHGRASVEAAIAVPLNSLPDDEPEDQTDFAGGLLCEKHSAFLDAAREIALAMQERDKIGELERWALKFHKLIAADEIAFPDAMDGLLEIATNNNLCATDRKREDIEHVIGQGLKGTATLAAPIANGNVLHVAPAAVPIEAAPAELSDPDKAEIARLARLAPIDYERQRMEAAKRLGIRAGLLDTLVKAERPPDETTRGQGRAVQIPDPEPWPAPVQGAELLTEIVSIIRRYVIMPPAAADVVALWVVHTHAFDAAQIAPRLLIKSPEKRCGNTTLLTLIANLARRPLPTSNITPPAIFRTIELIRPTLLIDEVDTFLSANEEMRGIVNSGHTQAIAHVTRTVGEDFEPRQFSTWAPMATAGIGKLPGTIEDRGIAVTLRRRRKDSKDEQIERLRFDRVEHLKETARRAFRWATDHHAALIGADPAVPNELHDRAADNWRPLLAIADRAGGEWPGRARQAAIRVSAESADDQDSIGIMLLGDIRDAFEARAVDRISSDDLTAYLLGLDARPWPGGTEFNKGRPLTKSTLARLLTSFGIPSGTIRISEGLTLKGYRLAGFNDAFDRYLPHRNVTTSQAYSRNGCDAFGNVTSGEAVTFPETSQAYSRNGCDVVTFLSAKNGVSEQ
jgi:putative DNA primase/helicase